MVIVSSNRRYWWVGMAVSLLVFAVLYFTVIRPDNNTANQVVRSGLQQTQQAIKQAQQQSSAAQQQSSVASGQASNATSQAQKVLNKASKLAACVTTAGTSVSKLSACQAKYGG
jgi:hypothetical protein